MTLAVQIAERIHALQYQDISTTALDWTAGAFIDTVGVTLAGIVDEGPQTLLRVPGVAAAPGPALIPGTGRRTSVLDAALVSGVAA
ncbi:MAG: MmgE/PrpD family protein, partial [Rhodopila sp.]